MAAHPHAGVHPLPQHGDVARIGAAHEIGQKQIDDRLGRLRRHRRLRLAVTDEPGVGRQPDDHGVDRRE